MRYMLLIYTKEDAEAPASQEEMMKVVAGHQAVMDEATKRGVLKGAEPLQPTTTAKTVRVQNGKLLTTDGPFAETKEQLGGYYLLECKDLDEAIAWAARIPTSGQCGAGCVEIRPIREMSDFPDLSQSMDHALVQG
jgi:hypothetical protein